MTIIYQLNIEKSQKDLKLPKYIIDRKKKAAQYGFESEKAIKRLGKKHGFKRRSQKKAEKITTRGRP